MELVLGSDHGGFELKEQIKKYVKENYKNFEIYDIGCKNTESVDYPVFGLEAGFEVVRNNGMGIVVCGSGIGISIAANKVRGIRCALVYEPEMAELTRQHNDANMIALGGRFTTFEVAKKIVDKFLTTPFEGGRHKKRTNILDKLGSLPCTNCH